VQAYCGFLGCPRSGTTMLASLLTAHPNVIVSNELDALRFVELGFRREQLYYLIVRNDAEFTSRGREWSNYQHVVPGAWQGTAEELQVIGDKRSPDSLWWLKEDPALLDKLRHTVGVPIRFLHLTRNPFDAIATMSMRSGRSLDNRIETYFALCEIFDRVRTALAPEELLELTLEGMIESPRPTLTATCGFLGVDAPPDYLERCAAKVLDSPRISRHEVAWSDEQLARVAQGIARFEFLDGYSRSPVASAP
jgi:hypothetical protein